MRDALQHALAPSVLEIEDDSHRHAGHAGARDGRGHFNVHVVSERFAGLGPLARHRAVFGVGEEAGFDEARSVITNAYTGGSDALKKTFEIAPKHRNAVYNEFCERELDYGRGDDVLQLGRVDLAGARRYIMSEVPSGSLPALLAASAMLALQRLVLPVVYWLDDSRAFGTLRPRRQDSGAVR